jgi:hypothetical protein
MGLTIVEIVVKIIGVVVNLILWPIAIVIAAGISLVDGVMYGDWHKETWARLPEFLRSTWEHLKSPVFD